MTAALVDLGVVPLCRRFILPEEDVMRRGRTSVVYQVLDVPKSIEMLIDTYSLCDASVRASSAELIRTLNSAYFSPLGSGVLIIGDGALSVRDRGTKVILL